MQYNYFMKPELCNTNFTDRAAATHPAFGAGLLSLLPVEPLVA